MLKVIAGIAKVYVGEIVEEAKRIQVREDYVIRKEIEAAEVMSKQLQNQPNAELKEKQPDKCTQQMHQNDEKQEGEINTSDNNQPKQEQQENKDNDDEKQNEDNSDKNEELSSNEKEEQKVKEKIEEDKEDETDLQAKIEAEIEDRCTLTIVRPLSSYHLKLARDEYQRKRSQFEMKLFG